jgi:hypothetical protein
LSLLARVRDTLADRASQFARVEAVAPVFAPLRIAAEVALAPDADRAVLAAAVKEFLSPWSEAGIDLPDTHQPRELAAAVLRFLRERPEVVAAGNVIATLGAVPEGTAWVVPLAEPVDIRVLEREAFGA